MDEELLKYLAIWDKSQAESPMEKMAPPRQVDPNSSFFGMNQVDDEDDEVSLKDLDSWTDATNRADQRFSKVDSHALFNEAVKEGAKKKKTVKKKKKSAADNYNVDADPDDSEGIGAILAKSLGDVDQFVSPNPITVSSVGMDQKLRVTPNWTSGKSLAALAKMKSLMYDLECEMLSAEALDSKGVKVLETRLQGLQKQMDALSQDIVPKVKNDVS
jgi:hypothetical protein